MISEPAPQTGQPQVQCRLIRSKWMFIEAEPDPTVPRSGAQYLLVRAHPEVHGPGWPSRNAGGLQLRTALLRSALARISSAREVGQGSA